MGARNLISAREEAAAETLARIRRDAERVRRSGEDGRWQVAAFLDALCRDDLLFTEGLEVSAVVRLCGIRDGGFSTRFHAALGCPPSEYLRQRRLEVAARMLRTTDYPIALVAEMVGVVPANWFSQAFKHWAAESPRAYRKRYRAGKGSSLPVQDPLFVARAFAGELGGEEAELYLFYLRELYSIRPAAPPRVEAPDQAFHEEFMAEVVWRRIRRLPQEEQERTVRGHYGFRTPALFELLLAKSREEGQENPHRGLRLAELALASLDAIAEAQGENIANLKTRAWAWVGNAHILVYDLPSAETAFTRAEAAWSIPRGQRSPLALAEISVLKGKLRYCQRRFDEALALNARALELLAELDVNELLVRTLISRAGIERAAGRSEHAIPLLHEALALLESEDLPALELTASCNLAIAYIFAADLEKARGLLERAKAVPRSGYQRTTLFHLLWVEGLIEWGEGRTTAAEELFLESQKGFAELAEPGYHAVVSVDLGELYADEKNAIEALRQVANTMPFFESQKNDPAALVAVQLIRDALDKETLPGAVLERIRGCLEELRKDPLFPHQA